MKPKHIDGGKARRVLFRTVGGIIAVILLFASLALVSHREHFQAIMCFLFAILIIVFILLKRRANAMGWFGLFGLTLLLLLVLGFYAMLN